MISFECHSKEIPGSQRRERERLLDVAAASQPGGAGEWRRVGTRRLAAPAPPAIDQGNWRRPAGARHSMQSYC